MTSYEQTVNVTTQPQTRPATNYRQAHVLFIVLRWLVRGLLRLIFRVEVRGLENLPKSGGYILAGNHLSWLDPFLLLTHTPATPRVYFIAAKENMQTSPLRDYITTQIGGVIKVMRGRGTAHYEIEQPVTEVLQGGGVLGIFPEGTVSQVETGRVLPFKKGVGHFASRSGVPIVPVALSGTKDLWLGKQVTVIIGQPVENTWQADPAALTAETAARIQAILPTPAPLPAGPKLLRRQLTNLF